MNDSPRGLHAPHEEGKQNLSSRKDLAKQTLDENDERNAAMSREVLVSDWVVHDTCDPQWPI